MQQNPLFYKCAVCELLPATSSSSCATANLLSVPFFQILALTIQLFFLSAVNSPFHPCILHFSILIGAMSKIPFSKASLKKFLFLEVVGNKKNQKLKSSTAKSSLTMTPTK